MPSPHRRPTLSPLLLAALIAGGASACKVKPGSQNQDGGSGICTPGEIECAGSTARTCSPSGQFLEETCPSACVVGQGCVDCVPGTNYCHDNWVATCTADHLLDPQHRCDSDSVCILGQCLSRCDPAVLTQSNVGCEFWAVDLDNEAADLLGVFSNDAAAQQYAVVVANGNDYPVQVQVFRNGGRVGQPLNEELVITVNIAAGDLAQIDLPQREVDGTMGQNSTYVKGTSPGSFVSPHAYRVVSNGPVVAYQFNPIIQQFSNDASILIPTHTLGRYYYVLGWPTANPCAAFAADSIPDHTSITIVGVEDNTSVTIYPTHPVEATGGDSGLSFDATDAGGRIDLVIDRYDVVNVSSLQPTASGMGCLSFLDQDGDFTGSRVESDKPVAVFSSLERGAGTGGADPPPAPGWDPNDTCCTDHLEQQMFPVTALGFDFVISRSPVRSTDASYREPDLYRILATVDNTVVTTSLPAPYNTFNLNAGEFVTFHAYDGFIVQATGGAIMVGQYLLSQGYIPQGGIGDPTFIVFPAAAQHRNEYIFLVPTTFSQNYMVLTIPDGATFTVDGNTIGEFNPNCTSASIGTLNGTGYTQLTCSMTEGTHRVESTAPLGLTVYGYYNVGSYGYPGGSDVREINPVL